MILSKIDIESKENDFVITTSQINSLNIEDITAGISSSSYFANAHQNTQQFSVFDTDQFSTLISGLSPFSITSIQEFKEIKSTKYVIAGNQLEYQNFLKRKGFSADEYKYVYHSDMLYGMRNIHGYYVGSWRSRTDIDEIKKEIENCNISWETNNGR